MTDAEKASFQFNALVGVVARLNGVNAGNGTTLTTADATRTTLTDAGLRRRSVTINFAAFFPKTTVSPSSATSAAATITSGNPLIVSYTLANSATATAMATTASAISGTASPTSAPTTTSTSTDSSDNTQTVIIATVVTGCFVLIIAGLAYKVHQKRDQRNNGKVTAQEHNVKGLEGRRTSLV